MCRLVLPGWTKGQQKHFTEWWQTTVPVSLRARAYILLAAGQFLCTTRVWKNTPEQGQQRKVRCILEYIKGMIDLEYTLGAYSSMLGKLQTWVNAC